METKMISPDIKYYVRVQEIMESEQVITNYYANGYLSLVGQEDETLLDFEQTDSVQGLAKKISDSYIMAVGRLHERFPDHKLDTGIDVLNGRCDVDDSCESGQIAPAHRAEIPNIQLHRPLSSQELSLFYRELCKNLKK